jgi:acetyl-CoA C-acetyltransferase
MKSVMLAAQAIQCGDAEIVVAGGMENMSLIPHYMNLRNGTKFGPATMIDGMQKDGLVDAYDNNAMGVCADLCAAEYNFLEKTKISTQFNRMSVQRKLGKQVNLITK